MYLVLFAGTNTRYCSPREVGAQRASHQWLSAETSGARKAKVRHRPATPQDRKGVAPFQQMEQGLPGAASLCESNRPVSSNRDSSHDSGSPSEQLARFLEVIVCLQRHPELL